MLTEPRAQLMTPASQRLVLVWETTMRGLVEALGRAADRRTRCARSRPGSSAA